MNYRKYPPDMSDFWVIVLGLALVIVLLVVAVRYPVSEPVDKLAIAVLIRERDEAQAEVVRLRQVIVEHHNASRLQRLHAGDTCPICVQAGLAWPFSSDSVHSPPR